jgi:hypothetical protein
MMLVVAFLNFAKAPKKKIDVDFANWIYWYFRYCVWNDVMTQGKLTFESIQLDDTEYVE